MKPHRRGRHATFSYQRCLIPATLALVATTSVIWTIVPDRSPLAGASSVSITAPGTSLLPLGSNISPPAVSSIPINPAADQQDSPSWSFADPSAGANLPAREWMGATWASDHDPAMAKFADWSQRYLDADPSARAQLEAEGVSLAATRRAALEKQISTDPKRALGNAVPLAVREGLPPAVQDYLEERVSGFGNIATIHTTPNPGGDGAPNFDYVTMGQRSFEAFRYGGLTKIPYANDVSLHGIAIGSRLAVLDSPVRVLEAGESIPGKIVNEVCPVSESVVSTPRDTKVASDEKNLLQVGDQVLGTCQPSHAADVEAALIAAEKNGGNIGVALNNHDLQRLYIKATAISGLGSAAAAAPSDSGRPPTSLTFGGKNILIMRVQPPDKPFPGNVTEASLLDTVWRADGWNTRTKRISYNQAWINRADVTPVMTLPQNSAYYVGNGYDWNRWVNDSRAAAAARGYNLNDYACFVVAHDAYTQFGAAGWGGGGTIWCNGNFDVRLFVHEYGHVFWLPHANSWYTTDGNPISGGRQHREYGDANDPMGNAWGANQFNTYNAYFKNFCGWLPDTAVQLVARSGTYRIYQDDGATALNRPLALKFGRDREFNYWVTVRGDAIAQPNFTNGVAVMATSATSASDSHLLDMNNPGDDNRDNAPLVVNQSWYDSAADVTIRTVAIGGSNPNRYADVQVTFGPRNTGAPPMFLLVNKHAGKAIDVIGGNPNNGAVANQWSFDYNGTNQHWALIPTEAGNHFRIISQVSGRCLCVINDSLDNNAQIHTWDYVGNNPSQQWDLVDAGNGWYKIRNVRSGKVLDVENFSTADNAKLQQYTDGGTTNQLWRLQPWGDYSVRAASGRYVCVEGRGSTNGARIIQYDWENNPWFKWRFESVGEGNLKSSSLNALGRVLCVVGGSAAAAANCHIWDYNPNNVGDQKLRVLPKTNGKYKFYFVHDGLSWDIPGGQTGNNVPLQQYPNNAFNWQEFELERTP